jgi:hypothetical protein
LDRTNKLGVGIALIAIVAIITTASVSFPAVYAKKHHHLTDTEKEDSTASDSQGRTCDFGSHNDECPNSSNTEPNGTTADDGSDVSGFAKLPKGQHYGNCQPSEHKGLDCEILNDT